MTNKDKAILLRKRHLNFTIEWGGVKNIFLNVSSMSIEGVEELLDILSLNNGKKINSRITILVQKEYDKN